MACNAGSFVAVAAPHEMAAEASLRAQEPGAICAAAARCTMRPCHHCLWAPASLHFMSSAPVLSAGMLLLLLPVHSQ